MQVGQPRSVKHTQAVYSVAVPVSLNMRIFLFAYFWIKLEYNHPNNRDNFVSLA